MNHYAGTNFKVCLTNIKDTLVQSYDDHSLVIHRTFESLVELN
jgi:hypothetical protein